MLDFAESYSKWLSLVTSEALLLVNRFWEIWNKKEDLVNKCTVIYDFFDEVFDDNMVTALIALKTLLIHFKSNDVHLSQIKTLLVVSKAFKDVDFIKEERAALVSEFEKIKGARNPN